jgi:hypothetical protein
MMRLIENGRLVEVIIALMLLEAVALLWWHRRRRAGLAPAAVLTLLASGVFLMLALRAALIGSGADVVAAFLGAALLAHVADLATRWSRSR